MADIQPGATVTVAADIVANGVVVFAGGEQVTVQQVSPNPQMPQYKYSVYSTRAGKWYQLRDEDVLAPAPQVQPGAYAQPPQQPGAYAQPPQGQQPTYGAPQPGPSMGAQGGTRPAGAGVDFSGMQTSDWLVAIGGIVMFIGTFFWFTGYGILFPLMGVGLVILVVLDKIVKVPAIAEFAGLTWVYIIIGGVGTLLGAISMLRLLFWLGGLPISSAWYITPVLELLANVAVLIGGIMRFKEG